MTPSGSTGESRSVKEIQAQIEQRPGLSEGLRAGNADSLIEFFELTGAKVESITVRQLA